MKYKLKLILLIISLIGLNCNTEKRNKTKNSVKSLMDDKMETSTATPPKEWIAKRVASVQKRLTGTKEGQILCKAMERRGGLARWYTNGPLHFRFTYKNLKTGGPDTYQTIDTWSSKARHQLVSDTNIEYGWDGKQAWKYPYNAKIEENPRFWALTPFYFLGIPFVLVDEGIHLKYEGIISLKQKDYHQIRVTFDQGIGDAPNDFYVVYIDANSFRIGGLRYSVTYPGFYDEGDRGPVYHMIYYGEQNVEGIRFPKSIETYNWDGEKPTNQTTNITISDLSFLPDTSTNYFKAPEGSRVMDGYNFD
ncbi:hypothetical protein K8352_12765 [Flavobacteriaceae bacterium F89]|uniref:Uncharacterized protein n=1 Tax=Cerina litoralis TaxID=2874477 RepID=A0AAE3JP07_9FLAO|nr:DUF6503 family protein [Cerina litoralis]MCG2461625.1 hypothetical protein [Cerina litoralis]